MQNEELQHWGIKGMRWGIRRFQKKDGSLTPAGKKRVAERESAKSPNPSQNGESTPKRKSLSKMSEKELIERTNRNRLEKTYVDSTTELRRSKKNLRDQRSSEKEKQQTELELLREQTAKLNAEADYINAQQRLSALKPEKVSLGKKIVKSLGQQAQDKIVPAVVDVGKKYMFKKLGLEKAPDELTTLTRQANILRERQNILTRTNTIRNLETAERERQRRVEEARRDERNSNREDRQDRRQARRDARETQEAARRTTNEINNLINNPDPNRWGGRTAAEERAARRGETSSNNADETVRTSSRNLSDAVRNARANNDSERAANEERVRQLTEASRRLSELQNESNRRTSDMDVMTDRLLAELERRRRGG